MKFLWLFPLTLVLGSVGCAEKVDLESFNATSLELVTPYGEPSEQFELVLGRASEDDCGRLDSDVVATVNGTAVTMTEAGDPRPTLSGPVCESARFKGDRKLLTPASGEETRIVIQDDSRVITYVVKNAGAERKLTSPPELLLPGSRFSLHWSPETDEPSSVGWGEFQTDSGDLDFVVTAEVEGHEATIEIPAGCPARTYHLVYQQCGNSGVKECTGVNNCFHNVEAKLDTQVTVQKP